MSVSAVFTWDKAEAERLAESWRIYLGVPVYLGGPAYGSPADTFTPGRFVKAGVTFTSRGCDRRCPWCLVPEREGKLRLLPISDGYIVNDNNFAQCPKEHRAAVYEMLRRQPRAAVFAGGIDARLVTDEFADEMRSIRVSELFLAADTVGSLGHLRQAAERLAFLTREKLRCFVMVAYGGETIEQATARLEAVYEAGAMPFCQLYQPPTDLIKYGRDWQELRRTWSRPAAMKAAHRQPRRD